MTSTSTTEAVTRENSPATVPLMACEVDALRQENARLRAGCAELGCLRAETARLRSEVGSLRAELSRVQHVQAAAPEATDPLPPFTGGAAGLGPQNGFIAAAAPPLARGRLFVVALVIAPGAGRSSRPLS